MNMRALILPLLTFSLACALLAPAQPAAPGNSGAGASGKPAPAKPPKASEPAAKPVQDEVDPAQAYKANCLRCHAEPRKFSEREMVTVMRHMRVRANLTEAEEKAILRYLSK